MNIKNALRILAATSAVATAGCLSKTAASRMYDDIKMTIFVPVDFFLPVFPPEKSNDFCHFSCASPSIPRSSTSRSIS